MPKHDPNAVALVKDLPGECGFCRHRTTGKLVLYYSGEAVVRCNYCKKAGNFTFFDESWNDPNKYAPFIHDDD